jgi:hypothetical protein
VDQMPADTRAAVTIAILRMISLRLVGRRNVRR